MSIIADFLVRLGYDLDESSEKKVESSTEEVKSKFEDISESVIGVKEAILAIASSAVIGKLVSYITEAADKFEALNDLTSQLGSKDAEDIASLQYAFSQMGTEVDTVNDSLLNFTDILGQAKMGEGEGVEVFKKLNIDILDANGNVKDTATVFKELNDKLKNVDQATRVAYINMLGLDTELAKGMGENAEQLEKFQQQYRDMYKNAGVDINKASEQAKAFNQAIRTLEATFQSIKDAVGVAFLGAGVQTFEKLRKVLEENTPKMIAIIKGLLNVVMSIATAFLAVAKVIFGAISSIIDWWSGTDEVFKTTIKIIGGVTAALLVMNTAFMQSPLGRLLAIVAVIGAIIDDFQVWKEGGNSLIGELIGGFDELMATIDSMADAFGGPETAIGGLAGLLKSLIANFDIFIMSLAGGGLALKTFSALIPSTDSLMVKLFKGTFGLSISLIGKLASGLSFLASGPIKILISAIGLLSKAFVSFGIALLSTPVGWILAAIAAIVAAGIALYQNWDTVVEFLSSAWEALVAFISAKVESFKNTFQSVGDFIASLPDILMQPWIAFFDWLASKFEWIGSAKDAVVGAVSDVASYFGFGDDEKENNAEKKEDSGGWFDGWFGGDDDKQQPETSPALTRNSMEEAWAEDEGDEEDDEFMWQLSQGRGSTWAQMDEEAFNNSLGTAYQNAQDNLSNPTALTAPSASSSTMNINQENGDTIINIQAAENPQETAAAVASQQQQVQSNAARNLRRNFA